MAWVIGQYYQDPECQEPLQETTAKHKRLYEYKNEDITGSKGEDHL